MQSIRKKSFAAEQLARQKKKSPTTIAIIVLAVVIAVGAAGYALYVRFGEKEEPTEVVEPEQKQIKSIAVLPLKNMIGDPEQLYFTDGMHDALINNLSKIGALRVVSNTSVMQYRDNPKPIPEIARELGVDAVIEGSVFRAENQVRIIVQLIATNPERHLWSNEYTRELRNVMSLQNEVARAIASEIKIAITPEEEARLATARPVNTEAYDSYLRGNDYRKRSISEEDKQIAVSLYQKAIDLDPEFALAYAGLSIAHSRMYTFYYDRTQERLARAKEAADRALELEPVLPEAHLAMGIYYFIGYLDYDRALEQFTIARESQPNNSELLQSFALIQRHQGKFEQALANFKKASDLDPLNNNLNNLIALTLRDLRRYQEAESYYDRAILQAPDIDYFYSNKSFLYVRWEGNTEKARAVLGESPLNIDSAENPFINTFITLDVYDGNYQEALDRLNSKPEDIDGMGYYIPKTLRYALIYRYMNRKELAHAHYDSSRIILETKIKEQPEDHRSHSSLGIAYAGLGRKEEAIREGKLGVALHPVSKDAWRGIYRVEDLARIYVMVGEYDRAIEQLEFLLSKPGRMTVHLLRLDPIWAPLRDHPRFQKLLDTYDITDK